jgi:type II secretory pathway pseudopilin PulG
MAALLVGMSIAAVLMTVAMPTWRQMVRREQESELVFRGQQYVRAIGLFQKQAGPGVLPPNLDTLVNGHFLRKKFKDPITNQDFDLLSPTAAAGQQTPGGPGPGAGARGAGAAPGGGRGFQTSGAVVGNQIGSAPGAQPTGGRGAVGGIIGVASKSKAASIRTYNGRTHYNEWQFVFVQQTQAPGSAVPGQVPGQRGAGPAAGGPQRGTPPPFGSGGQNTGRQGLGGRGNAPTFPTGGRAGQPAAPTPQQPTSPFAPRR